MEGAMLVSYVNTKLRDGEDLGEICAELGLEEEELTRKLAEAGVAFDEEHNRFCG